MFLLCVQHLQLYLMYDRCYTNKKSKSIHLKNAAVTMSDGNQVTHKFKALLHFIHSSAIYLVLTWSCFSFSRVVRCRVEKMTQDLI